MCVAKKELRLCNLFAWFKGNQQFNTLEEGKQCP